MNTSLVGDVKVPRRSPFHFPNPVNEWAARSVAFGVFSLAVLTLVTGWYWITLVLFVGFALRLGWGPRYSPLGRLAVHVIAPGWASRGWCPARPSASPRASAPW